MEFLLNHALEIVFFWCVLGLVVGIFAGAVFHNQMRKG